MLTKQQAAEFLGVNVRTLERYTQERKIGGRYAKGKTRSVLVYDEKELQALSGAGDYDL
jgi:predicted site-specific integrase-resolvase